MHNHSYVTEMSSKRPMSILVPISLFAREIKDKSKKGLFSHSLGQTLLEVCLTEGGWVSLTPLFREFSL